jgi:hypothetical protein
MNLILQPAEAEAADATNCPEPSFCVKPIVMQKCPFSLRGHFCIKIMAIKSMTFFDKGV